MSRGAAHVRDEYIERLPDADFGLRLGATVPLDVRVVASPLAVTSMLVLRSMESLRHEPRSPFEHRFRDELVRIIPASTLRRMGPFDSPTSPGPIALPLVGPNPTIEDELHPVASGAPAAIAADAMTVDREIWTPDWERFVADPVEHTARFIGVVLRAWERIVRPTWGVVVAAVERERAALGRAASMLGWREALAGFDPSLRMVNGELGVLCAFASSSVDDASAPLLLAPTPALEGRALIPGADAVSLFVSGLDIGSAPAPTLSRALGETRASLLAELETPATTTELAARLNRSPGAISEMLSKLVAAGLVERERQGAHVWYRRSDRGDLTFSMLT